MDSRRFGDLEIVSAAEDLIAKCQSALHDPQADRAGLRALLADCLLALTALLGEQRSLRAAMRDQLHEIAALVAAEEAVWPEEVARLDALSRDIRNRAALFADG